MQEHVAEYQGGLSFWDKSKEIFFRSAHQPGRGVGVRQTWPGWGPPLVKVGAMPGRFARPRFWGARRCYRALIEGLYRELCDLSHNLMAERQRLEKLFNEVNRDIHRFESGHDMMLLNSYLRSMDPQELVRRKILGVNFSAKECSLAAEAMCFRLYGREELQIDLKPEKPRPV